MAYASTSDVTNEFKSLTLNDASVSSAKVTEWLAQADAYINAKLGLRYVVPITGTAALIIVKQIETWLVAGRVKDVLEVQSGSTKADQGTRGDLGKKAEAMLSEIVAGKMKLTDATLATSADGVRSFNVDESEEHTFKKGEDQW